MGSKIHLDRLAFVHYKHPDLENARRFLLDFGFVLVEEVGDRIYFRGHGQDPYVYVAERSLSGKREFGAAAWVVESLADLERASELAGASKVQDLDGPGGGKCVSLLDPNGMKIILVYQRQSREQDEADKYPEVVLNTSHTKPRKGVFQRFKRGPSRVHKLGHYGFNTRPEDFLKTRAWYLSTFNLAVTDSVYDGASQQDVTSFIHIDKGLDFVDHHSFFVNSGPQVKFCHIHHSSFEVDDLDTQLLGHHWLENHGWTNCWGVGRHLLGSQIFDYWFDSSGNVIEHYTDGDMVNSKTSVTREVAAPESLFVWGPNVPLAFITGKVQDAIKSPNSVALPVAQSQVVAS